jgi:radical SAM protein with 4Fe4S-binding SPASM domain
VTTSRLPGWGHGVKGRPLYTQEGSLVTHRSVGPEQYGRFLIDAFEEWVRRDIGTVYVQMFDTALANWYGEGGGMCVHAETCGSQLALEHTGDLYSCDHYVEPGYLLGNIKDKHMLELIVSPQQRQFGQDKRDSLTRFCRDCDVRFACNGGCPKDRFATSPYGEPGQHYLCPRLQGLLPPYRQAHGNHGQAAACRPGTRRADGDLRRAGLPARPQRPLPLRQRPQMETLPRRTSPRLQPSEPADGLAALIAGISSVLLTGRSRA